VTRTAHRMSEHRRTTLAASARRLSVAVLGALLGACAFLKLHDEVSELENVVVLTGTIVSRTSATTTSIVVAAVRDGDGRKVVVDRQVLARPGPFGFILPHGRYDLVAFEAGDGRAGRPARWGRREVDADVSSQTRVIDDQDIELSAATPVPPDLADGLSGAAMATKRFRPDLGAIADLEQPIFSASWGEKGLWEPMTFIRNARGGVFFLEKYDAAKTPVLFVHGAGGSPQDWRRFFDHLDRSRFQPWFYYYPSGIPLNGSAYWLNRIVDALHERYGFERLAVTAHSMGGLVASRFIALNSNVDKHDYVKLLVTLSTPWAGVASAQVGIDYAPAVIPSWVDVAPASKFLATLHGDPLPPGVAFYLFFSHRGGGRAMSPGSDGVVTLASQLDDWAQRQAKGVFGFDADHDGILSDPQVLARYNALLESLHAGAARGEPPRPPR
jgi:pimeloyl-ACP methyl ester carboxylesterase